MFATPLAAINMTTNVVKSSYLTDAGMISRRNLKTV